jgi:hypothetical protein
MGLSEEAKSRLADIVTLQPTKNAELQERWGMESGSEVHGYLENELKEYYYRDDNSLIRATAEAADLVDVEPGIEDDGEGGAPSVLRVPELQYHVLSVAPDHDEDSVSVVATLQRLRERTDLDPDVDDVRAALRSLANKGALETVKRTVPTYRLAVARESLTVELVE